MPTPAPARRSQAERRATTERRVVDAAITLIAEHGWHGVSTAAIGDAAGYSRGIVHHHFGGREALLAAVLDGAQGFDLPETELPPVDRLRSLIAVYLSGVHGRGTKSRAFLVLWAESPTDSTLSAAFAARDAGFVRFVADILREGAAEGSLRDVADPEQTAVIMIGLLRGVAMQLLTTATGSPPEAVGDSAVALVLQGLLPEPGKPDLRA